VDDDLIAAIRRTLAAEGWQVVLAGADAGRPAYAFTIGLSRAHDHPELVVVGLDDAEPEGPAHELLEAAAEMVAEGHRFEAGAVDTELLENHSVAVRAVSSRAAEEYLGLLHEVLGEQIAAVQLVWPDRRGLLPWSPACDPAVVARQPVLEG
jgi:hypothetical protein